MICMFTTVYHLSYILTLVATTLKILIYWAQGLSISRLSVIEWVGGNEIIKERHASAYTFHVVFFSTRCFQSVFSRCVFESHTFSNAFRLLLTRTCFWHVLSVFNFNICFAVRVTAVLASTGIFCSYESFCCSSCRCFVLVTTPSWHTFLSAPFFPGALPSPPIKFRRAAAPGLAARCIRNL